MVKKFISLILSFLMTFSLLTTISFATEPVADSNSNVSVEIEASETDENGIVEVTVTVTPKEGLYITAYTLALEYDSSLVTPDMDNAKAEYVTSMNKNTYFGIKLDGISRTNNFRSNYFNDSDKDIFIVTDVNQENFYYIVEPFSITYFFEATESAKSNGGKAEFKLLQGKTSINTVLFSVSGHCGNNEVFVDSLSRRVEKSVIFPINEVKMTGTVAIPVKNKEDSSNVICLNENVDIAFSWSPALINGKFASDTVYTAIINITPKSDCAFDDSFSAEKITGLSEFTNWTENGFGWVASKTFEKTEAENKSSEGSSGGGGGGGAAIVQKPSINVGINGKAVLSKDGTKLTITADEGYIIKSVILNGEEKGAVSSLKGLKTGDKVVVTFDSIQTEPEQDISKFSDVKSEDWFAESVEYVFEKGLMNGVSEKEFAPNSQTTRAMLMTILARKSGIDTSTDSASGEEWYDKALKWAKETGISDGTNPEQNITREQLAAMLWRAEGKPETNGDLSKFNDADKVSDYAKMAISWAVEKGIMNGKGDGILDPLSNATRAEMAAMLMRYCELEK